MVDEPASAETLAFSHTIQLGPFGELGLKNGLLNIVTLTLYRFWGKTEVRRRLWSAIRLNDEPFEYTGRGKELFLGFLAAIGLIVLPFLVLVLVVQFFSEKLLILLLPLLYLGLFFLVGAGIFLAFRYLASRTTWRGVRFQLRGSPNDFGLFTLGGILLTIVTFGWYAPAFSLKMYERLWSGLSFGDQPFRWVKPQGYSVYRPFALAWGVAFAGYIVLLLPILFMLGAGGGDAPSEGALAGMGGLILLAFPIYAVAVLLAAAAYQVALLRRVAASIHFGEARFTINVRKRDLIWLYFSNYLIVMFTLGFLLPLVEARTARFMVRRLTSEGTAPLSAALQAPQGPRTGEGIADALGFAFV